ncbi:MAG: ABC transporter permease [Caldilineaceae bacterium]|nr:ABC transporter permease [Caldilineaceae bacterium]
MNRDSRATAVFNRAGLILSRSGWTLGVWLLLLALLIWYANLIPRFGEFQITSISKNSLPLVYLALGQAIIVIAGGIDLSLGALLLLSNAIAARFMADQPFGAVVVIALLLISLVAFLNGMTGYVIRISGVPDIVVTLATSYIWSGLALWILPSPGGGTAPRFRWLFTGSESGIGGTYVLPVLMMIIPATAVFLLSRRTRLGLSMYAVGSDSNIASLAGLGVTRAKVASYALGGALAALAGLATVAITGTGDPRFSVGANATLNSVAAVVLGGIALTGGTGLVLGVVAAGMILIMLNPILSAMGINPNNAQILQGVLIAIVMMIGGLVALIRERRT